MPPFVGGWARRDLRCIEPFSAPAGHGMARHSRQDVSTVVPAANPLVHGEPVVFMFIAQQANEYPECCDAQGISCLERADSAPLSK